MPKRYLRCESQACRNTRSNIHAIDMQIISQIIYDPPQFFHRLESLQHSSQRACIQDPEPPSQVPECQQRGPTDPRVSSESERYRAGFHPCRIRTLKSGCQNGPDHTPWICGGYFDESVLDRYERKLFKDWSGHHGVIRPLIVVCTAL
jgi:hypothetical protein